MSINDEKLKKAVELDEKYGIDQDKIMLMESDEFKMVMGENLDIYTYDGYLQKDYMPTSSELAVFKGPTLDYVKSIIERVDNINNFNQDEIRDLNNILVDLKTRFNKLKDLLEIDKKLDEDFILSTRDIYTREEYRREELSRSISLIFRCNNIIDTLNKNIEKVSAYLNKENSHER